VGVRFSLHDSGYLREEPSAGKPHRDEEVPEESGGPFVETSGRSEFAYGTDASNPKDAEQAPFPTTRREK
jgi:hypothetical protein